MASRKEEGHHILLRRGSFSTSAAPGWGLPAPPSALGRGRAERSATWMSRGRESAGHVRCIQDIIVSALYLDLGWIHCI